MKTTGRDIWGTPPGGFEARPRRTWIRPLVASALVLSLGIGGGALYASMKRSTAVSTKDAVARFRAEAAAQKESSPRAGRKAREGDRKARSRKRARSSAAGGAGGTVVAAGAGETATSGGATGDSRPANATRSRGASKTVRPGVPQEGVYAWSMDGIERGPGVERRLPKRSHRIITHEGGNAWVEHHIFSEQKEMWFHLGSSGDGVAVSAVRNRVEMGPVEVDRTVTYDPPAFVSRFPFDVGQTWEGSWDGPSRGTYTGKTLDHGTLEIGGESVEVWVTEVTMELRGEVEGTVITRSWVAPDYNMVVRQYQKSDVKSGPGNYFSEWEGRVLSLHPQR